MTWWTSGPLRESVDDVCLSCGFNTPPMPRPLEKLPAKGSTCTFVSLTAPCRSYEVSVNRIVAVNEPRSNGWGPTSLCRGAAVDDAGASPQPEIPTMSSPAANTGVQLKRYDIPHPPCMVGGAVVPD